MATETQWCQNPKCPEKKNSNQIRGSKGNKYYQSNKANGYGSGNFCTQGCADSWCSIYMDRAIDSIGVRITEPVKVGMENAWYVEYNSNWSTSREQWNRFYLLVNKLFNVRHPITRLQATGNNNDDYCPTITSAQAKVLAEQLGLTSQK
tara:strand:+ start:132 stop:578 length:447 start_codon:yes stop_codon:yes gene_type:complete